MALLMGLKTGLLIKNPGFDQNHTKPKFPVFLHLTIGTEDKITFYQPHNYLFGKT